MSKEVLEIVRGISQVVANTYDGALDENGDPIAVGLEREEGNAILDKRVIDGFNVSLGGNVMTIKYQGEIHLKEVYKGDFEGEIAQRLQDIANYMKKEYKKVTGKSLSLTKIDKEPNILVQSTSRVRTWVEAQCAYKIGGMPEEPELGTTVEERLDSAIKKWIGFGKNGFGNTPKAQNVKGKRDEEPRT